MTSSDLVIICFHLLTAYVEFSLLFFSRLIILYYSRAFSEFFCLIVFLFCYQRETIGNAAVKFSGGKVWTYRYNQPNPTENEPGITEHAAENWMMFLGSNTGYVTL